MNIRSLQSCILSIAAAAMLLWSGQYAHAGTPAITLEFDEIVEYWYWAGGVEVTGSGFAPETGVEVTGTDPEGGVRRFLATTDVDGAFAVRINAMKLRSVLGTHLVLALDDAGNSADAELSVIRNPHDVLEVTTTPSELTLADFASGGTTVHISGLAPNGLLKINLGNPVDNAGELMTTQELYADADGEFEFVLDPNTQVSGWSMGAVVPVEGVWVLSVHDFSGNENIGSGRFRMRPDNPGTDNYCTVTMADPAEPITLVSFADIHNPSAIDATAQYEDFTAQQAVLTPGQTYTLRLQGKARWDWNANTYTVFIDWNRNGTLDDDGEVHSAGWLIGSTGDDGMEVVHDITVPDDAVPGPARMRVLKTYSPSSFAMYWPSGVCGTFQSAGQIEDYSVLIEAGEPTDRIFHDGFE